METIEQLGYVGYFLLGWLIDNFKIKKPFRFVIYALGIISVVTQILVVQFNIADIPNIRNFVSADLALPVIVYGASVYLLIDTLCGDKTHNSKIITTLSNTSFGVYMIHVAILEIFMSVLLPCDKCNAHPMLYFLMMYGLITLLSFVVAFLISQIKYVRKIIHIK